MIRSATIASSDLRLVACAPLPDAPSLGVGDRCRLLSGSPDLLVVDADESDLVTVAWPDGEGRLHRAALRRVPS